MGKDANKKGRRLTDKEQKLKTATTQKVLGLLQNALDWDGRKNDAHNPPPFTWGSRQPIGFNPSQHLDLQGVEADVVDRYLFGWAKNAYEQTIFVGRNRTNVRSVLDTIWVDDPIRRKKTKASLAGSIDRIITQAGAYAEVPVGPPGDEHKEWEALEDNFYDAEYWFAQSETKVGYLERLLMDVMDEVELPPDTFTKLRLLSDRIKQHVRRIDNSEGSSTGYLRSYSDIRAEWVRHLAIVWREFLGQMPSVHTFENDAIRRGEMDPEEVPEDDERVLYEETERFMIFADACCYPAFGKKKVADEEFAEHTLNPSNSTQTENRVRHALRGFNPRPKDAGPPW